MPIKLWWKYVTIHVLVTCMSTLPVIIIAVVKASLGLNGIDGARRCVYAINLSNRGGGRR